MRLLIFLLVFLAVPAFAQDDEPPRHGREMTEEEKREMREWVKRGAKEERTVTPGKPREHDAAYYAEWAGNVFSNPLTYLFIAIMVVAMILLKMLGGIQVSVNEVDAINQRQQQILDEDVAREAERQRNWEELNRRRR